MEALQIKNINVIIIIINVNSVKKKEYTTTQLSERRRTP